MLNGKEHENKPSPSCNKGDSDKQSSISSTVVDTDTSNLSSSLPSEYNSTSLNPRITFQRALSTLYSRWVKVSYFVLNSD